MLAFSDLTACLPQSPGSAFLVTLSSWIICWLTVFVHRAYISPLARFPGPKLAAATFWYEFYYEIYPNRFQYLWHIKKLHEQYGPIVRINPIHIHIDDADFFDTIYAPGNKKRNRCSWWHHSGAKIMAGSLVETIDHDLHRSRRRTVDPFFSKRSVLALEYMVIEKVQMLLERFRGEMRGGKEASQPNPGCVNLSDAMSGLTMDVISDYCFGKGMGCLDRKGYGREYLSLFHDGVQMRTFGRQFPWLINTMMDLPRHIIVKLNKNMGRFSVLTRDLMDRVERIKRGEKVAGGRRTIMHELLNKDLSKNDRRTEVVTAQAMNFLGAGSETTARTLSVAVFYVYHNADVLQKLRTELRTVMPDKNARPQLHALEALTYLSAVVTESLRTAHGVSSRQPRIATDEVLQYKQWMIPKGTALMQSLYLHHTNPDIFPEPLSFKPERWIENPKLGRYDFSFGKGAMSCLGMKSLATSELYLTVAYLVRWFDLDIWDTVEERDVLTSNDVFIGMTSLNSEGIKMKIVRELTD